jgi:hypothetical protein
LRLRRFFLLVLVATVGCASPSGGRSASLPTAQPLPAACQPTSRGLFQLPSDKGLNYGVPTTVNGEWLGSRWLRPHTTTDPGWQAAKPRFQADLDFIASHNLGTVLRLFIGLDQLMVWDRSRGFVRYNEAALDNLSQALDMVDAHHQRVFAVLYDQEEVSSPGNFHLQALDGSHPAMRAGYLRALDVFLPRFGSRPTVIGWDLFNEPYNSLGADGGLGKPPGPDPVSPNYSNQTVRAWMLDEYRTARCAAPNAWFTFSDTTELYWKSPPDTALYAGAVDYYDIHIYDNHPSVRDWRGTLDKPYVLGEVGGSVGNGLANESVNSRVVGFWLAQGPGLGASAVLAQVGGASVYSLKRGLMRTGQVVAAAR